jgi:hypothetical protein
MKNLKISKTVYPPLQFSEYNNWSAWFFGLYSQSIDKSKKDWSNNIYTPKK